MILNEQSLAPQNVSNVLIYYILLMQLDLSARKQHKKVKETQVTLTLKE